MVTASPPTVSISCSNGPERVKDTTNNIRSGNGFTVNIISEPFVEQANVCSIDAPSTIGEWAVSGLTKEPSVCLLYIDGDRVWVSTLFTLLQLLVKAARVKESAFSMECEVWWNSPWILTEYWNRRCNKLFQIIDIVDPVTQVATTVLILGLVKHIHVRKDVLNERGMVDPAKFKPIGRLGDNIYSTLGNSFRLSRPVWKDEQKNVEEALRAKA